jgi:hypothetical protein
MMATFNPNLPVEHTLIDAAELRNQFNALQDQINGGTEASVNGVDTLDEDINELIAALHR